MSRPEIAPELLAGLLDAAPARIRRKLDAEPALADAWDWSADGSTWTVRAGPETVTLTGTALTEAAQARCGCLLSPRCLHLLAVLSLLTPSAEGPSEETESEDARSEKAEAAVQDVPVLTPAQEAAVGLALEAGAALLSTGAHTAGTAARTEILRTAYTARAAALPRLATAATRLATGLRDLAAGAPEFALSSYADDLAELLAVAHRLRRAPSADDLGTARRVYTPMAPVRMFGLCSEPVLAASGYAGVVTHLADERGGLWTVPDLAPGGAERIPTAYRNAVRLGSLSLTHHDLGRAGFYAQNLTSSPDRRLGGGGSATAARLPGAAWTERPLAALWESPAAVQLDRAFAAPDSLLFLDATVTGGIQDALLVDVPELGPVRLTAPPAAAPGTLHRLSTLAGRPVRVIARLHPDRPRTLTVLALSAGGHPHLNPGLDRLTTAAAAGGAPHPVADPVPPFDSPLAAYTRILERVAMAGRATAAGHANTAVRAESARLRDAHLETAAALLTRLHRTASELTRTPTGESRPANPAATATAWTAAMLYAAVVRRALLETNWSA